MPPDRQLILRSGMKPMQSGRARWFTDPEFYTRVRPPPEIPKMDISIPFDDGRTRVRPKAPAANAQAAPPVVAAFMAGGEEPPDNHPAFDPADPGV